MKRTEITELQNHWHRMAANTSVASNFMPSFLILLVMIENRWASKLPSHCGTAIILFGQNLTSFKEDHWMDLR